MASVVHEDYGLPPSGRLRICVNPVTWWYNLQTASRAAKLLLRADGILILENQTTSSVLNNSETY